MKKVWVLILLIVSVFVSKAQDSLLNRYLIIAAENNPSLKSTFMEYLAALEQVEQVGVLPDPQLAFAYFISPVQTKVGPQLAKVSISQMFPWFGNLKAKENVAIANAKAKYELFLQKKSQLFYQVRSAYYQLYFLKQSILITEENLSLLNSFYQLALVKVQAAKASGVDLIRIEMEIADLENNLARLKDIFNTKQVEFNLLLNLQSEQPVILPDSLQWTELQWDYQTLIDSLQQNHAFKSLDYVIEALAFREKEAKTQSYPSFVIGADYTIVANNEQITGFNDAVMLKVGISIPIYRNKYSALIKQMQLLQQANSYKQKDQLNQLQWLLEKAYFDYIDAQRRINLYKKQKQLAFQAIKLLEAQYKVENRNFEEIIRMQRKYLQYSLQLQQAYTDLYSAIAFIFLLIGK